MCVYIYTCHTHTQDVAITLYILYTFETLVFGHIFTHKNMTCALNIRTLENAMLKYTQTAADTRMHALQQGQRTHLPCDWATQHQKHKYGPNCHRIKKKLSCMDGLVPGSRRRHACMGFRSIVAHGTCIRGWWIDCQYSVSQWVSVDASTVNTWRFATVVLHRKTGRMRSVWEPTCICPQVCNYVYKWCAQCAPAWLQFINYCEVTFSQCKASGRVVDCRHV
jgi:hypothetical protein